MIDLDMFNVRERDGLRLIFPNHGAGAASAGWTRENVKLRSRVETSYGSLVSQGFSKFFNLGQGPDGLRIGFEDVVRACERGDAIATLKLDGSLLIRSEYRGEPCFRTRGSFGYEHLDNAYEMLIFEDKYPKLWEVGRYPHMSLLFEWTSPSNRIVLRYPDEEITLIGAVQHYTGNYVTIEELTDIAADLDVPLVDWFSLTSTVWGTMGAELSERHDIEGYVVRINGEQDLVKVKATPYLTRHALKSTLNTEGLIDMWFESGQPPFGEFCDLFRAAFDEETTLWAMGAISKLFDGIKVYRKIVDHMTLLAVGRRGMSRKDAAIAGMAEYGQTKRFSLYMMIWAGKDIPRDLLKTILLQNTSQVELGMFSKGDDEPERVLTGAVPVEGDGKEGVSEAVVGPVGDGVPHFLDIDGYGWGV